jgi:hypothetical protein
MELLSFRRLVSGVLMSLCLSGCSVESTEGRFPDLDASGSIDMGADVSIVDGQAGSALSNASGTWALLSEDRLCIFADVGDPVENLIWSTYLVTIEDGASGTALLRQTVKLCGQRLSPLPFGFLTIVPEALTRALSTYDFVGFLANRDAGSAYVTEAFVDLWGAEDVAYEDEMPVSAEDPRVIDQDGDGEPGVTLPVTTADGLPICQVRVVQRTRIQLEGQIRGANLIEGEFQSDANKVVLSASSDLCASGDVGGSQAPSRFMLVRVSGDQALVNGDEDGDGEIDCSDLMRARSRIAASYGFEVADPESSNCMAMGD